MSDYTEGSIHQLADRLQQFSFTAKEIRDLGRESYLLDFRGVLRGTHRIVKVEQIEKEEPYLQLISEEESLLLDSTDGTHSIGHSSGVFDCWIDPDFKNWGLNTGSNLATEATNVQVYEMIKFGTFEKIYGSLGGNLDKLCLTQGQIVQFCQKHRDWLLADGYGTFFLFKANKHFFVAGVVFGSDGLEVSVRRLSSACVWYADLRRRFVVPQLNLGS